MSAAFLPSRNSWRWALVFALFAGVLWTVRPMWSVDIGFHLRAGEWIVCNGALPGAEVFMVERGEGKYVNPSWLYQAGSYWAYRWGGEVLFGAAHSLAWALALGIFWVRCAAGGGPGWAACMFFGVGACVVEGRISGRPESVALMLFGVVLWALEAWRRGDARWLPVLPAALALWVNIHGTFVLGWVVIALYGAGGMAVELRVDRRFLAWAGVAFAVTFLTPNGLAGVMLPFEAAGRFSSEPIFRESIPELWSPWRKSANRGGLLMGHALAGVYYGMTVAGPLLMAWGRKAVRWEEWAMVGLFSAMAAGSVRMTPFFAVACAPVFARAAGAALGGREAPGWLGWCAAGLLAVQCARVVTGADYGCRVMPSTFSFGIEKRMAAATCSDFLAEHAFGARVLQDVQVGSWLVWARKEPSFFLGNMEIMGAVRFREYLASQRPGGLKPLLERIHPDVVALEVATSAGWFAQLVRMEGWRLVYTDEVAVVFARDGFAPEIGRSGYCAFVARSGRYKMTNGGKWKALFKTPEGWAERWFAPRPYRFDLAAADTAMSLGEWGAAEAIYLSGLEARACNDDELEVFRALGSIYDAAGDVPKAIACYTRVLAMDGGDQRARDALDALASAGRKKR